MTRGGTTPAAYLFNRRTLTGAALIALVCGSAIGQAQDNRNPIDFEQDAPIGSPKNPEPVYTIAQDEALSPTTLYLAVGRIDTSARKDTQSLAQAIRDADADDRMLVQLDGAMTPERRARMIDAGLTPMGYLPTNAFIVRPNGADADKAANLDFVRWHSRYEEAWKTAPEVGALQFATPKRLAVENAGRRVVDVSLFQDADLTETLNTLAGVAPNYEHTLTQRFDKHDVLTIVVDAQDLALIEAVPEIQFIEPTPEVELRNASTTWIVQTNVLNQTPLHDAGLRGQDQIVAVSDGRVRADHCSFDDTPPFGPTHRKIEAYNSSQGSDSHGTHVAGTAVGDSGAAGDLRGIAYEARMVFDTTPSFNDTAMYNMCETHHNQGARVHTNSWGNDGTTAYDGLSRGIDRFSYDFEDSLVLFAVTNGGVLRNPENAKNVLACGATDPEPNQGNHCTAGVGPTTDGRRKPEIYAPGCSTMSASAFSACGVTSNSGTSMATPAIAGTAALVRQYYTDGFYPSGAANPSDELTPTGALVKATLLNSTVDMTGVPGFPSNLEGWGRLLADNALFFPGDDRKLIAKDVRNAQGMTTGQTTTYNINVSDNSEPLNITLVWTEPPATSGSSFASINDLNLRVLDPSGDEFKGNVFTGGSSSIGGAFDDRNNVESVRIDTPEVGAYTIEVVANAINEGTQGHALVLNGFVNEGPLPLSMSLSALLPEIVAPGATVPVEVEVNLGDDTLVGGSVQAFSAADGVNYTPTVLSLVSGTTYGGTVGPFDCGDTPKVYFVASGAATGAVSPGDASLANPKEFEVGVINAFAQDDFELPAGWSVTNSAGLTTGAWERADPMPTEAQPGSDTTIAGTLCFVTDGAAGANLGDFDVDDGATTLTSPIYDLSGVTGASISYNRWYSNDTGGSPNTDVFLIQVSDDNGASWELLEQIGPAGAGTSGGWIEAEFRLEDFITLTNQVRIRFIAEDAGVGSIVEAAIDDLLVSEFSCDEEPLNSCVADFDNDGDVDLTDFGTFGSEFGRTDCDVSVCLADFDEDNDVDLTDFGTFGSEFGNTGCLD